MAKFGITRARQELGFTPSTAVRADIDVRGTGGIGGAIGQAAIAVGRLGIERSEQEKKIRQAIAIKDRANLDVTENKKLEAIRSNGTRDIQQVKDDLPPEEWDAAIKVITDKVASEGSILNFSPLASERKAIGDAAYLEEQNDIALADKSRRFRDAAIGAAEESITALHREGDPEKIATGIPEQVAILRGNGKSAAEILSIVKDGKEAGEKLRGQDAANDVYAAVEAASTSTGGDFSVAKALATDPSISEEKQNTLRNTINSAEKKRNTDATKARDDVIKEATSTATREFFQGTMTIPEIDKRHEDGLITDEVFKLIRKGLEVGPPDKSDPVSAGILRRNLALFKAKAITQQEAELGIASVFTGLDEGDRKSVNVDLEDVTSMAIGTSKSNAYSKGRSLMSVEFIGITTEKDLAALILREGVTDEDRRRINRRWIAELDNRDLYERAVDEKFGEMRKDGITDLGKFDDASLGIMLEYRKRRFLDLKTLEAQVSIEQSEIISGRQSDEEITARFKALAQ